MKINIEFRKSGTAAIFEPNVGTVLLKKGTVGEYAMERTVDSGDT